MLAIVAPGQGAQRPGFLAPWMEDADFAARLEWLGVVAGIDLAHMGVKADLETITDTAVAQPLLVASGLLAAASLFPKLSDAYASVGVVAGHSVGELTAAAGAGVLSPEAAIVLVRQRGLAMAEAARRTPTSMTAILGGDPDEVAEALAAHQLTAANRNGKGQVVAAGRVDQLESLAASPPARARLVRLNVAGAFHTVHMAPAVERMASLARAITPREPRIRLLSNADGEIVASGRDYLERIVAQVAAPVRWDKCQATMTDLGVTGLLELPPAGTLAGIAKRNMPGVECFTLDRPDQLEAAAEFVARHSADDSAADLAITPPWRLVVSPIKGEFVASGLDEGSWLAPGARLGAVRNLREDRDVTSTHGGRILEWLVADGDLVSTGQPLVRLHPDAEDPAQGVSA